MDEPLPFWVRVEARDASDAPVPSYNGTADLTSSVGVAAPASMTFANGLWEGYVTVLADLDPACHLTATDQSYPGLTGDSNVFSLCSKGDVDGDGIAAVTDILRAVNIALRVPVPPPPAEEYQRWAADMDHDHLVTVLDVVRIVNKILGRPVAAAVQTAVTPAQMQLATRKRGDVVEVTVSLKGAAQVSGISFALNYDPQALELLGVARGGLLPQGWALRHHSEPGAARVLAYDPAARGFSGKGAVVVVTFRSRVKGRAPAIGLAEAMLSDTNGSAIPVTR
jgi:hypothetical protein